MYVIWLNITTGEKQTYNNKTEKKQRNIITRGNRIKFMAQLISQRQPSTTVKKAGATGANNQFEREQRRICWHLSNSLIPPAREGNTDMRRLAGQTGRYPFSASSASIAVQREGGRGGTIRLLLLLTGLHAHNTCS